MGGLFSSNSSPSGSTLTEAAMIKTIFEYCKDRRVPIFLISEEDGKKIADVAVKFQDSEDPPDAKKPRSGVKVYIEAPNTQELINGITKCLDGCSKVEYRRIMLTGGDMIEEVENAGSTCGKFLAVLKERVKNLKQSKQIVPKALEAMLIANGEKLPADDVEKYKESEVPDKIPDTVPLKDFPKAKTDYDFSFVNGCCQINVSGKDTPSGDFNMLSIDTYIGQLEMIRHLDKCKSGIAIACKRLNVQEQTFNLHKAYNVESELNEQAEIANIDYMSVRKCDTHCHAASAFTSNELATYIRKVLHEHEAHGTSGDACCNYCATFTQLNIMSNNVTAESLKVRTEKQCRRNFERFELKFLPFGKKKFQEIFLKWKNNDNGKFLAELLKEKLSKIGEYEFVEWGISVYGHEENEMTSLADWIITNGLISNKIRWKVQLKPRFAKGKNKNLGEIFQNIFKPMLEATKDANSYKTLYEFMLHISAFDVVGNEGKSEYFSKHTLNIKPQDWTEDEDVPFAYFLYYLHVNISTVNQYRRHHKLNAFALVPHCGEAGCTDHYAAAFLLAHGISHGLTLAEKPVYTYLYFLASIPIAFSFKSNIELMRKSEELKFDLLFKCGLIVYPTTDDRLMFFKAPNELLTEYTSVEDKFDFTSVDMCMMARNSIAGSAFPEKLKQIILGWRFADYGIESNVRQKSNCPNISYCFRTEAYSQDSQILVKLSKTNSASK